MPNKFEIGGGLHNELAKAVDNRLNAGCNPFSLGREMLRGFVLNIKSGGAYEELLETKIAEREGKILTPSKMPKPDLSFLGKGKK